MKNHTPTPIRINVFLAITVAFLSMASMAQHDKKVFQKYGLKEGLPEENVYQMAQDELGFIWYSTQNGFVKYDGYSMEVYGGFNRLGGLNARRIVTKFIEGRHGKFWLVGINHELASYDPSLDKFTNYLLTDLDTLGDSPSIQVIDLLLEDIRGNIWFVKYNTISWSLTLCRMNPNTREIFTYPFQINSWVNHNILLNLRIAEVEHDSSIWISDNENIHRYNIASDQFVKISNCAISGSDTAREGLNLVYSGKKSYLVLSSTRMLELYDPIKQRSVHSFVYNEDGAQNCWAFEDLHGNYWIVNDDRLTFLDGKNHTIREFSFGEGKLHFENAPDKSVVVLPNTQSAESIWFNVMGGVEEKSFLNYSYKTDSFSWYNEQFNSDNNIVTYDDDAFAYKIMIDRSGLTWLYTSPNFYKETPKNQLIDLYQHDPTDPNSLPDDSITYLFEDSKSRLWIGTSSGGLAIHQSAENNFRTYKHDPTNPNSISNNKINQILEDSDGNIWIATDNGLNKLTDPTSPFRQFFFNHLNDNEISVILEDDKNQIWVSVLGTGVFILSRDGSIIQSFKPDENDSTSLLNNRITKIYQDNAGNMWLGSHEYNPFGLFRKKPGENRFELFRNISGDTTFFNDNRINLIGEDPQGQLWIAGTLDLYKFDTRTEAFRRTGYGKGETIANFGFDENGELWIGTYAGGGLGHLSTGNDSIVYYGTEKGLLHNDFGAHSYLISELIIDNKGYIYYPTQRGLSVFDPNTKKFRNFTAMDGYKRSSRGSYMIKTKNGDIWEGSNAGLFHIVPSKLFRIDSTRPSVVITSMTIEDSTYTSADGNLFKKSVPYTKAIELEHWQKDLGFEFVALHYLRPEQNQYSWKLEGYDDEWTVPSTDRKASYTNLLPGQYTFKVKGSNADGIWNEEGTSLSITIHPPWWLSTTAYLVYGLLFILGVLIVDRYQRKRLQQREQAKARERELEQAKEIEKAYKELKTTQTQLVHAEKMASLGELTAGIAHEIQNPLNFVNNFSEVNTELVEDLKDEIKSGETDEALALADDIGKNEKKIVEHGKRADSIVKGMLQHSRTGNGQKENTDLNALADEYLRLAYHGLRAKDSTFNVDYKTELDPNLPKVNVVPQDIGRVLLNLINNAFQACAEQSRSALSTQATAKADTSMEATDQAGTKADPNFKPLVVISTKALDDKIEIRIKDNGPGIPKDIREKVFQPFFTTKATGEGTGLGLSLSYDIITKGHGGSITLETEERKSTEFIIQIPLKTT